jgi:hypothetical protein
MFVNIQNANDIDMNMKMMFRRRRGLRRKTMTLMQEQIIIATKYRIEVIDIGTCLYPLLMRNGPPLLSA